LTLAALAVDVHVNAALHMLHRSGPAVVEAPGEGPGKGRGDTGGVRKILRNFFNLATKSVTRNSRFAKLAASQQSALR
jgi:hypothetical protein